MRPTVITAVAFALFMVTGGLARADGGGSDGGSSQQTCPPGEVYDSAQSKCVQQRAGVMPDKAMTDYAWALIKARRYGEALQVLALMKAPDTAVALNYRGYATRKLGRIDEGIGYYRKSVSIDPDYAQVREYLGEAYLVKGDMSAAKAQLQEIRRICGTTCEAYEHLAVAIADPADL